MGGVGRSSEGDGEVVRNSALRLNACCDQNRPVPFVSPNTLKHLAHTPSEAQYTGGKG